MARFRLKSKHYLRVPGTTWEQQETDRTSGRQARKAHEVPMYLDPESIPDQNYPGEVIVSTKEDKRYPRDYIFVGLPTPDMEPLDEEAEAMWQDYMRRFGGEHPIDSLEATGFTYSDKVLEGLVKQVADLQSKSDTGAEVIALKRQITELTKQLETARSVRK